MARAVRSDDPEAGAPAVGHHVHRVALVDDPLAVRRDLGARRPLQLEDVLGLEARAGSTRRGLQLLARRRATRGQDQERGPRHPPPSVIPHAHLPPRCRTLCRVSGGVKPGSGPEPRVRNEPPPRRCGFRGRRQGRSVSRRSEASREIDLPGLAAPDGPRGPRPAGGPGTRPRSCRGSGAGARGGSRARPWPASDRGTTSSDR